MVKFNAGEEQINTERAFISDDISALSTEALLAKLEELRTRRGARPKSVKKAAKQEKEAKLLAELEQLVPPEHRDLLSGLAPKEKKQVLMEIAKQRLATQAAAAIAANEEAEKDAAADKFLDSNDGDVGA